MPRCGPFVRDGKPYVFKEGDGWVCSICVICQKCGDLDLDRLIDEAAWPDAIAAALAPGEEK